MSKKITIYTTPGKVIGGAATGLAIAGGLVLVGLGIAGMEGHESWPGYETGKKVNKVLGGVFSKDYPAPIGHEAITFDGTNYPYDVISDIAEESCLPRGYVDSEFDKLNPDLDFGKMIPNHTKYIVPIFPECPE